MNNELINVTPWAPLIYKIHYPGDLTSIVQKVRAEHVMTQPNIGVMSGGGKTSVLNQGKAPHGWTEMTPILEWFRPHIKEIWKQWQFQSDIELNITKSDGYVEEHDHGGCHFAVSMYLEKPEGSGDIQFRNMNLPLNSNTPKQHVPNGINDYFTEVKCNTGDALIFPGWLPHKVPGNPTDKERIVFSFNVHGVSPGSPIVIGDQG